MKILLTVCICAVIVTFPEISFSQKLSFGEYTGINFSNLHGNLTSNKWEAKAGPSAGFFAEYKLTRLFSIQAELGFLNQYYEYKNYKLLPLVPDAIPLDVYYSSLTSNDIWAPFPEINKWDFSFLRLPLLIRYSTPTRLQLGLGAGVFYSVLMNDDLSKEERNTAKKENRNIYPPTHEWGYLFSADLSYPVASGLRVFLSGRLSTGQKVFIENYEAKNGANEILFGLKYTPRKSNEMPVSFKGSESDSTFVRCYIKPGGGVAMTWNSDRKRFGNYSDIFGLNAGILFGYRLDKTVSIQTGFQFQQKGYAFRDSSYLSFRYVPNISSSEQTVDTHVSLNYLTVPLNFSFSIGEPLNFYFDLGIYADFMLNAYSTGTVINEYSVGYNYRLEKRTINDAIEGYYKPVDFGYLTGFGFQFPFKNKMKFDIGLRYAEGFKNILKEPDQFNLIYDDISFKNSCLSIQFGLLIPIPN